MPKLIFALILLSSAILRASPFCGGVFSDDPLAFLQSSRPETEPLLRLMRNGLHRRYSRQNDVMELTRALLARSTGKLEIDWPEASFTVEKSKASNDVLTYRIPTFVLKEKGVPLDFGGRPKGMNLQFAKALVGIAEAVRIESRAHPELESLEIIAGNVVNDDLIKLLKQLGFSMKDPAMSPSFAPWQGLGGLPRFPLHPGPLLRTENAQNWSLRFKLNPAPQAP